MLIVNAVCMCRTNWIFFSEKVRNSRKDDKDATRDGGFQTSYPVSAQVPGDADPGVISEGESEDDFTVSMTNAFICWHMHACPPSLEPCFKEIQV